MHFHFVGIGGIGMSALAKLLMVKGYRVSGCDLKMSAMTEKLQSLGTKIYSGHDASHVSDVDVLVISTAIPDDHPEVVSTRAAGKRVIRRIELLGELMNNQNSIGVVGTHGKTTTTAMVAHIFVLCGLDPTVVLGGELESIAGNVHAGNGQHFIAEVDESDTYFQHLSPNTAVITNIEDDHVASPGDLRKNYHSSLEALYNAFRRYANNADRVVYCADWSELDEIVAGVKEKISYGLGNADYQATNIDLSDNGASYDLLIKGNHKGHIKLAIPGDHNVLNSLAAIAVADLENIPFDEIQKAISTFRGADRRWQMVGNINGALVIDDYAHHPTEIIATLAAAKASGKRVRVVFQPHRFLRTAQVWERSASALMKADDVFLLDVYGAGETPIAGIHSELILNKMQADGHKSVSYFDSQEKVISNLLATAREGEIIVTMGAGDVWRVGDELIKAKKVR